MTGCLIFGGIYHFLNDKQRKRRKNSLLQTTIRWTKIGKTFTYLGLLFYIFQTLTITIQPFEPARSDESCDIWEFFATAFYHWSKSCLYALFIARLQIGFSNSAHSYSKQKIIYPLYILLFIYVIVATIADYTDVHSTWNNETKSCEPEWAVWGLLLTVGCDLFFTIICLVLFTRPLCKLAEYSKQEKNPGNARKFEVVVRKYSTLVSIAVISSIVMLFVAAGIDSSDITQATVLQTLIMMDNFINVCCMFLLSSTHNKLYGSLCKLCIPSKMRDYPEFSTTRVVSSDIKGVPNTDLEAGRTASSYDDHDQSNIDDPNGNSSKLGDGNISPGPSDVEDN